MDTNRSAAAAPSLVVIHGIELDAARGLPGQATRAVFARGLRIAWRRPGAAATSAGFYLLVAGLVSLVTAPLGVPAATLAAVAAWIGALLATLLAQQHGMREDADCGVLDQVRLAPGGAFGPVAAMLATQVIATALPLLAVTPAVALFFGLSFDQALALLLSLAVGLPAVCVLAAFVSVLTLGSRATPAALGLLLLPLSVPMLLFGVRAAGLGPGSGALALLAACSLVAAALGPFAVAAAISLEDES